MAKKTNVFKSCMKEDLLQKLESITCPIHHRKADLKFVDERIEIVGTCCEDFREQIRGLIDEDLHQRYVDDLDNLFS
jgi:hypothetical protein